MMGDVVRVCGCGDWRIIFCWMRVRLRLVIDCLVWSREHVG